MMTVIPKPKLWISPSGPNIKAPIAAMITINKVVTISAVRKKATASKSLAVFNMALVDSLVSTKPIITP